MQITQKLLTKNWVKITQKYVSFFKKLFPLSNIANSHQIGSLSDHFDNIYWQNYLIKSTYTVYLVSESLPSTLPSKNFTR